MTNTIPSTETASDVDPKGSASEVPDVGETFTRDELACVVTAWLKRVPTEPLPEDLRALFPDPPSRPPLLVFCVRDEAEYVSAYCGHGLVVPVAEAVVTGRASWKEVHFRHARQRAAQLIGSYAYPA